MKRVLTVLLLSSLLFSAGAIQAQSKPINYLGVKGPVRFQQNAFSLAWSSHPTETYFKHEYLQPHDSPQHFKKMLLLEVLGGDANLVTIVGAKMNELKTLKATNPAVEYNLFSNKKTGEYLLDFVLTADGSAGKDAIAERNVYRYKKISSKAGKTAVLLFGVSSRTYGKDIAAFLVQVKTEQKILVNAVTNFELPAVKF